MKTLCVMILVLIASSFTATKAQDMVRQTNDQFTAQLSRDSADNLSVNVALNDPSKYTAIIIEKGRWSESEFRQCAYFDVKNALANISIFDIKIDYPLTPVYDAYYRIKLVTTDGKDVIFPVMVMPAKQAILPKNMVM